MRIMTIWGENELELLKKNKIIIIIMAMIRKGSMKIKKVIFDRHTKSTRELIVSRK